MTDSTAMVATGGCHFQQANHCGYPAPGVEAFFFTPLFKIGGFGVTKPILLAIVAALLVILFFAVAFWRPKLVPHGVQNVGEMGILFVRDQILRPQMGKKGDGYLPLIVSLFFFIWVMNVFGIIPVLQFPPTSKYAIPVALTAVVWVTYISVGIRYQGLGYFKNMAAPKGAPWWILPLLAPIELFSNILVRPFTLSIRLFANMLAGHLLLLVFGLASWYLASLTIGLLFAATSLILTIVLAGLEVLIQALQAFIFATLTAFYIGDAMESAH